VSLTRVLKTAQALLSHTFYANEVPTSASGPVTYNVTRLDGSALVPPVSGTATLGDPGDYNFSKPGYANLDTHVVAWTGTWGGSATTVYDFVEVVGDFLFGIAALRAMKPPLSTVTYPLAELRDARIEAEQEVERITNRGWVPRFTRVKVNGSSTPYLFIPNLDPRVVRFASVAQRAGATFTPLSQGSLDAVAPVDGGILVRDDGQIWPQGYQNVILEYEYGEDGPPADLQRMVMRRCRYLLNSSQSSIPARTLSYSTQDGGIYRLSQPTADKTGIGDVDAVYERYTKIEGGFA